MVLREVMTVPHMAEKLMKGPRLADNLFLVGLFVNHVDSISCYLTASGCIPVSISPTSGAGERIKYGESSEKKSK